MKIKRDFVTNSSSTSFIMTFKDNVNNLFESIRKHKTEFSLSYDSWDDITYHVNYTDVIDALEDHPECIRSIDEHINLYTSYIDNIEKSKEKALVNKKKDWYFNILQEELVEYNNILNHLMEAKNRGATKVYAIDFGDNHGDVVGTPVGLVMDYAGRELVIQDGEFRLVSIQNR